MATPKRKEWRINGEIHLKCTTPRCGIHHTDKFFWMGTGFSGPCRKCYSAKRSSYAKAWKAKSPHYAPKTIDENGVKLGSPAAERYYRQTLVEMGLD